MSLIRILVVDDNELVCASLGKILGLNGFKVTCACDVPHALRLIASHRYDVLLSDLHMPGPGDGLTVVSAMRHANPKALTLLLSAFPEMSEAANAILRQADEILVKPMQVANLVETIKQRLLKGPLQPYRVESLAAILQRTAEATMDNWFEKVESEEVLRTVKLSREARCRHLSKLFRDLVNRLATSEPLGTKAFKYRAAFHHGKDRRQQGYTAAMLVEESRILQVTIFETLQRNLSTIDFSVLIPGVMAIADEIESQLSQAMDSYVAETGDVIIAEKVDGIIAESVDDNIVSATHI